MDQRLAIGWNRRAKQSLALAIRQLRLWRVTVTDVVKDRLTRARLMLRSGSPLRVSGMPNVLFVDTLIPDPLLGAGHPRAFELIRTLLRQGYQVDVYPMETTRADRARMSQLFGNTIVFHPGGSVSGLRRLLWTHGHAFDVLFVSRPLPMQAWVELGWRPVDRLMPVVIYDAEALLAPRERRRRTLFGPPWTEADYQSALDAELRLMASADAITAVSRQDAADIQSRFDKPVFILPHSITVRDAPPGFNGRRDLLFVGRLTGVSSDSPNVDSLVWFLGEVMPLLDTLIGIDYRFHIAGKTDAPELKSSDRIVLHGIVDDLEPLYEQCRVFVAPTRYAAGIPLKVLDAMGQGIPCVATPLLAAQLGTDAVALPCGDTAEAFAAQCARLYSHPQAWESTRDAATAYLANGYSPAIFDRMLGKVMESVDRVPAPAHPLAATCR